MYGMNHLPFLFLLVICILRTGFRSIMIGLIQQLIAEKSRANLRLFVSQKPDVSLLILIAPSL